MFGLCAAGLITPGLAAPPPVQKAAFHLDLHPPAMAMYAAEKPSAAFPSSLHRQSLGAPEHLQLPGMVSEGGPTRIKGPAEEFVQRVHREGLPVARLWENKSALVHLGLNQRGKPGLWLVQKIH
ncbi:MAG TPA: hypothetical protein VKG63_12760 [Steroidobacteraceae bacterium]|nr:hypothetical protein [Steroidobacteraceae bacterium]